MDSASARRSETKGRRVAESRPFAGGEAVRNAIGEHAGSANQSEQIVKGRSTGGVYSQPAECVNVFSRPLQKIVKQDVAAGASTNLLAVRHACLSPDQPFWPATRHCTPAHCATVALQFEMVRYLLSPKHGSHRRQVRWSRHKVAIIAPRDEPSVNKRLSQSSRTRKARHAER